jgi:hypothetical protein
MSYFREEQRFQQPWIWGPLILFGIGATGVVGYAMVKQLAFGQPVGDRPMSDAALAVVGPLIVLVAWGTVALFVALKLVVEVREDALAIHFRPFLRREIGYGEMVRCEACTYRPIREYGGWGIRFSRHGTAYHVRGNRGVQLELADGKRLLLGSQRADELAAAIQTQMRHR